MCFGRPPCAGLLLEGKLIPVPLASSASLTDLGSSNPVGAGLKKRPKETNHSLRRPERLAVQELPSQKKRVSSRSICLVLHFSDFWGPAICVVQPTASPMRSLYTIS